MAFVTSEKTHEKAKEQLEIKQKTVIQTINSMKNQIAAALPKHVSPDRLARIAMTAIRTNSKLALCSEASLLGAILQAAQLGLEPNTPLGECYLIPYGSECTFQLGYRGLLTIAFRSGQYRHVFAEQVYASDKFKHTKGLNPTLEHEPVYPQKGNPTFYYAAYQTINGGGHHVVWERDKVIEHGKKYSKSYNKSDSPWQKNFDAMAKKTAIIDVLRYGPKSIELQQAMSMDNAKINIDTAATLDSNEIVLMPEWSETTDTKALDDLVASVEIPNN